MMYLLRFTAARKDLHLLVNLQETLPAFGKRRKIVCKLLLLLLQPERGSARKRGE